MNIIFMNPNPQKASTIELSRILREKKQEDVWDEESEEDRGHKISRLDLVDYPNLIYQLTEYYSFWQVLWQKK